MKKLIIFLSVIFLISPCILFAENLLERGIKEYRAENYEEALDFLVRAQRVDPKSSITAFYLGLTYKQMGNYREAAKNYRNALTFTPPVNDAYAELIEMLYNLNELKEAKDWIAKAEKEKISPAKIAFLKGLVLLKENKNKEAIDALTKAKELDMRLAQAADLQIAMAYAKERRLKDAQNTLRALIKIDPASEIASFAKEYESAIEKSLAMHKTWRFNIGLSYQYDDNVVSKPSSTIGTAAVDNISGKRDSSIVNTFRVDYSPLPNGPWFFNAQYNLYSNTYFRSYKYDVMTHSVSLIPGYNFQKGALVFPLSYSHVWLNEREYSNTISIKPMLNMQIFNGHIGQFSAGYGKREMLKYTEGADPDEDRDAGIYSLSAGYLYPFSEGRGIFNMKYEYTKEDTQGRNWDNKGNRISASLLLPVAKSINLMASGDMLLQDYRNIHTVSGTGTNGYPAVSTKRRDRIYSGSAGLVYEMLKGLNINLMYAHTRADSNFAIYDYKRSIYTAGMEYAF